jgi:DNA-binding transcriptional ArsR family regulator
MYDITMNASREQADDFAQLAAACKALSHPARLTILRTLAQRGTCICGEIVEIMPLSQATVSQHLKVLREAGLIRGEVDGPRSCYCIDGERLRNLGGQLGRMFRELEGCC